LTKINNGISTYLTEVDGRASLTIQPQLENCGRALKKEKVEVTEPGRESQLTGQGISRKPPTSRKIENHTFIILIEKLSKLNNQIACLAQASRIL